MIKPALPVKCERRAAKISRIFGANFLFSLCVSTAFSQNITLTTSANPSTFGQSVTLTATVSPSAAIGKVTFYDGTTVLGTSTLSAGKAALSTILLPSGTRSLRAYFLGGNGNAPATSTVLSQTVNAVPASDFSAPVSYTTGYFASSLAVGDFNGDGKADLAVITGLGIQILLGNGDGIFQPPLSYTPVIRGGITVGDFHGDGNQDLAIADYSRAIVYVLPGNGDGTFGAAASYTIGSASGSIAVADFNGDGNADLVAATATMLGQGTVSVLLGNGDGTFAAQAIYDAGNTPGPVVVGDFNGDGKADLVVSNEVFAVRGGTVSVLLGNGDGTFQPAVQYPAAGSPAAIAVADFNGDGKLDLAVSEVNAGDSIVVLLGNGDGTFQQPAGFGENLRPQGIAVGDINGDGRIDVVVSSSNNAAGVLLGNGDGTFQPVVYYWLGEVPGPISIANFNSDGRADLALGNPPDFVSILSSLPPATGPMFTVTALSSSSNPSSAGQTITLTVQVSPSTAAGIVTFFDGSTNLGTGTVSGGAATLAISTIPAGTHSLTAIYGGDAGHAASTSQVLLETINVTVTSATLFSSLNPSNSGQSITLRATVAPPSATGTVTFIDGSTRLGSGTLVSGAATLAVATLSTGAHSLAAVYSGDTSYDGSTSAPLTQTVYAARTTTTTSLATSANPATYGQSVTLTATVSPSSATGSVTFYDGVTVLETEPLSNAHATLKTALLASGARSIVAFYGGDTNNSRSASTTLIETVKAVAANGFAPAVNYEPNASPFTIAVGDFNGDGKADLAVDDSGSGSVNIFTGNGDGTFQFAASYLGLGPVSVAVGDFNGDGKADLAAGASDVIILLGNGDGTFQNGAIYSTGTVAAARTVAVSDVNRDGHADLVTANDDGTLSVLLGNGDGTFAAPVIFGAKQSYSGQSALTTDDFNGDGIPDLAATLSGSGSVAVYLGNGDGSFQAAVTCAIPSADVGSIAAGDFNGDGRTDLAVPAGTTVQVLLGNGDGTFQAAVGYNAGTGEGSATSVAIADFNGDGKADLAVSNFDPIGFGTANVLLGNGDGTFEAPVNYAVGRLPYFLAAANFNGDGRADLAVSNQFDNNVSILLGAFLQSQTITFPPLRNQILGTSQPQLSATASSGLAVTFTSNDTSVCTLFGDYLTLLSAGTCSITASQPGNATYHAATPVTQTFNIIARPQTISFGPLGNEALGSPPPPLSATATSGLPVTYASNSPSVCAISGANVTLLTVGTCSIAASQPGDGIWAEATPVTQRFTVSAAGIQPVAAFLDQKGAPALTFNGSTGFPDAGGFLIGAPGVAEGLYGNTYVVGLDNTGGVHLNSYTFATGTWNGWQYSGGMLDTTSGLTAAVDPGGMVWFTGRDIGNRFWINSWNGTRFGGWILVPEGIFAPDSTPQIAIPSDGSIYIVGKDIGGRIWTNSYIPSVQTFTGWADREAVIVGQPSATAGQDGMVYVSVRNSATNSPVYIKQIPAQNTAGNTWLNGGGLIDTDPQITSQGGTVYLTALAGGGTVYLLTFTESNQAFGTWTFTNGTLHDETIATAAGNVFIAGRDSSDRIYWYSVTGNNWFLAGGAGLSSTVLAGGK